MRRSIKKGFLSLGLSLSLVAHSGVYQCKKNDISVPCDLKGWVFGGDALYIRNDAPALNNLNTIGDQTWNDPYDWGFRLVGHYFFGVGNDFQANWLQFYQNLFIVDNNGAISVNAGLRDSWDEKDKLNILNLEIGQSIIYSERLSARVHAGLQYAAIQTEWFGNIQNNAFFEKVKAWYLGPRVGGNADYHMTETVSTFTNIGIGALYTGYSVFSTGREGPVTSQLSANQGQAVDTFYNGLSIEADLEMGLKHVNHFAQGDLISSLGWNFIIYNGTGTSRGFLATSAYDALAFGLKWHGNT